MPTKASMALAFCSTSRADGSIVRFLIDLSICANKAGSSRCRDLMRPAAFAQQDRQPRSANIGMYSPHARNMIDRVAIASFTLRSAWANVRRTAIILTLALWANSSSSCATLSKALESGSSSPSWLKIRQKSFFGVELYRVKK